MVDRRVLTRLLEVHDLPTLPAVITRILDMVADENSSAADLTGVLEQDHAISARLLRLANSAFYGLRHRVESLRRAVVVLGFNEVRQLALATSVFDNLSKRKQFAFDPEDFWMHALGAARAAQILADRHCRTASHEGCFTAGLLHDIGKYVLALVLQKEYQDIVNEAQASGRLLREVEFEKIGTTHARIGRWIAEKWRFPFFITNAIGNMYRVTTYYEPDRPAVAVVALADQLSRHAHFGYAGDGECFRPESELLSVLGVGSEEFDHLAAELEALRDEAASFLRILDQKEEQRK
mgnify:CR=1 FL=1